MPFHTTPSGANPVAPPAAFTVESNNFEEDASVVISTLTSDSEEELPPDLTIPDSVPVSARKRLDYL
jgi:hypothetical protein